MSLTQEGKKQARVRFAESDTGDLTAQPGPKIAPLPELTIAVGDSNAPTSGRARAPLPSPIAKPPPTVKFEAAGDRDYLPILHQTKMVYDQLLCDKQSKLLAEVYKVKREYDRQCCHLASKNEQRALEYGVRAQAHLNELQKHADDELEALHADYQQKMTKMVNAMDEKWRQENPDKAVQYKVYLRKD